MIAYDGLWSKMQFNVLHRGCVLLMIMTSCIINPMSYEGDLCGYWWTDLLFKMFRVKGQKKKGLSQ